MDDELRVEVEPVEDGGERWAEAVTALLGRHPLTADGDVRLLRVRSEGAAGPATVAGRTPAGVVARRRARRHGGAKARSAA